MRLLGNQASLAPNLQKVKHHLSQGTGNEPKLFIDVAAQLKDFTDKITTEIRCAVNKDGLDTRFHTVLIQAPSVNKTGRWQAFISGPDCRMFQKYGACILHVETKGVLQRFKHALFMTRNDATGTCEIYDPNGSFENTFRGSEIKGFFQAVNMGLLRPLTSPTGNQTVFNVSLQSPTAGLQSFETRTEQAVKEQIESDDSLAALKAPFAETFFTDANFGFCMAWSIFRFLDCMSGTPFVTLLERAFLEKEGLEDLQSVAQTVLFGRFVKELASEHVPEDELKRLFNRLLPCIFIRLFAAYMILFIDQKRDGFNLGNSVEEFLRGMTTAISDANDGNVIFKTKHLWKDSWYLDVATIEGDTFFFKRADRAVKEYIFSVDTTQQFAESVVPARKAFGGLE